MNDADWKLEPLIDWMLSEGRDHHTMGAFVQDLSEALSAAGTPLARLVLSFRTLHPQYAAEGVIWQRDGGIVAHRRSDHNIWNEDAYLGSPIEAIVKTRQPFRRDLTKLEPGKDHLVLFEIAETGATDYFGVPVKFTFGDGGTMIMTTDRAGGFSETDIAKFSRLATVIGPVIEVLVLQHIAEGLLDTYLGPRTGRKVLEGQIKRGDGEEIDAAIWFSDLRDSTKLTETLPAADALDFVNTYFEHVHTAVTAFGGEILRFIGDAMLIVFPVQPGSDMDAARRSACRAALDAATDTFSSLAVLNNRRQRDGKPAIRFGVGLHYGRVIYGNVGAPTRLDFTVMGPAVNRTARLEGLTKDVGVPLLLSEGFAKQADIPYVSRGLHAMKGVDQPQPVVSSAEFDRDFGFQTP